MPRKRDDLPHRPGPRPAFPKWNEAEWRLAGHLVALNLNPEIVPLLLQKRAPNRTAWVRMSVAEKDGLRRAYRNDPKVLQAFDEWDRSYRESHNRYGRERTKARAEGRTSKS